MTLLFAATLFVNAALLFLVQPMVAKMILPSMGGTPAVWNVCLLFFQIVLLAGYLYAHVASRWLGAKQHALLHLLAAAAAALLYLPIVIPVQWFATLASEPPLLILTALLAGVGVPFFVLSAGAPLLQKWFAGSRNGAASDPYFLYAASNLGSMFGLAAYPVLFEPYFALAQQSYLWFGGYLALLVLTAACALASLWPLISGYFGSSGADNLDRTAANSSKDKDRAGLTAARRVRWLSLAFVPSSLLLGVTAYVTTDVVSAPLFWVVPLALYLLSFVLAFARDSWACHPFVVRRQGFLLLAAALTVVVQATSPVWILLPLHLVAFFLTALVCHGLLAKDRPPTYYLTEFYLWISLGGALGGLVNALLAPRIFNAVLEYPLAMIVAALMRPYLGAFGGSRRDRLWDVLWPVGLGLLMAAVVTVLARVEWLSTHASYVLIFGMLGGLCLGFAARPVRFGLGIAAVMIASLLYDGQFGQVLYANRSFFGVYRVMLDKKSENHLLLQGTTIHGTQSLRPESRLSPAAYFHSSGPAGQVMKGFANSHPEGKVAIVGLGVGALACHGVRTQRIEFFEIDPLVEKIARDARYFSFLRDCPPRIDVAIGDARVTLGRAAARGYDLFVLDAFSSDVIPVHLLTREALALYLRKTADNGMLLFHISNRYMDLAPVLDRLAKESGLIALIQDDFNITVEQAGAGKIASRWILLAREQRVIEQFAADGRWRLLDGRLGGELWTDEFSDVLKVLRWR